jgi:hypothetical protein
MLDSNTPEGNPWYERVDQWARKYRRVVFWHKKALDKKKN